MINNIRLTSAKDIDNCYIFRADAYFDNTIKTVCSSIPESEYKTGDNGKYWLEVIDAMLEELLSMPDNPLARLKPLPSIDDQ